MSNANTQRKRVPARGKPDRSAWPQIESVTLADRVYQIIRNRILHRELPPGTFIREQEVSRATGVSRTPVREAFNRLASEDFLERVPHRGFRIPDRPFEALVEVYPIINSLEVLAAKLAIDRIEPSDIAKMKELNRQLKETEKNDDVRARVDYNKAFHKVISDRSGNSRLTSLLEELRSQVVSLDAWHFAKVEKLRRSVKEHDAIIAALEAGDLPGTIDGLKANYSRARLALQAELDEKAKGKAE